MKNQKLNTENIAQWSEDAEIRFFENEVIAVDNYDSEVTFDKEKKFQAGITVDKEGNIQIVPFGGANSRGPRSITIIDSGVGKIKKSPMGVNVKLEIILPMASATSRNFTTQGRILLKELTKWRKENGLS